jgi:hypothetical protein
MLLWVMIAMELINQTLGLDANAQPVNTKNIPVWIVKSVDLYGVSVNESVKFYLVKPNKDLAFDQITNILNQVQKRLGGITLLIADDVNSRFRALFVKNNVPFIYKDKSIFAPALGLKLFDYKKPKDIRSVDINNEINPFELKLIAGYLTGFIVQEGFNLKQLGEILAYNDYQCGKSKLSKAVNQLIKLGYLDVVGIGPKRMVTFKDRDDVWDQIKEENIKRIHKSVKGYYMNNVNHIISGETALAHYSDLAKPKIKHMAITNKEFKALENDGQPVGYFGESMYMLDILKEPASLFAVDKKYVNPIELYFLLRNESDERILLSIDQMLCRYNLKG